MIQRLIFLVETIAHLLGWVVERKGNGNPIIAAT